MAKFNGIVGFGTSVEKRPGVWVDDITERSYQGDIERNTRQLKETGESLNNDLTVSNNISIVADAFGRDHFFAIRFVEWAGVCWTVNNVEVQHPRLILSLGGVYNGPRAEPASE